MLHTCKTGCRSQEGLYVAAYQGGIHMLFRCTLPQYSGIPSPSIEIQSPKVHPRNLCSYVTYSRWGIFKQSLSEASQPAQWSVGPNDWATSTRSEWLDGFYDRHKHLLKGMMDLNAAVTLSRRMLADQKQVESGTLHAAWGSLLLSPEPLQGTSKDLFVWLQSKRLCGSPGHTAHSFKDPFDWPLSPARDNDEFYWRIQHLPTLKSLQYTASAYSIFFLVLSCSAAKDCSPN